MKVAAQVEKVVKKAYGMLAFIGRGIEYKSWSLMLQLHRTLVRPHLEYCVPEGRGGFRESAEKVYQDVAWYGGS